MRRTKKESPRKKGKREDESDDEQLGGGGLNSRVKKNKRVEPHPERSAERRQVLQRKKREQGT